MHSHEPSCGERSRRWDKSLPGSLLCKRCVVNGVHGAASVVWVPIWKNPRREIGERKIREALGKRRSKSSSRRVGGGSEPDNGNEIKSIDEGMDGDPEMSSGQRFHFPSERRESE
jgi:hypothetical protein